MSFLSVKRKKKLGNREITYLSLCVYYQFGFHLLEDYPWHQKKMLKQNSSSPVVKSAWPLDSLVSFPTQASPLIPFANWRLTATPFSRQNNWSRSARLQRKFHFLKRKQRLTHQPIKIFLSAVRHLGTSPHNPAVISASTGRSIGQQPIRMSDTPRHVLNHLPPKHSSCTYFSRRNNSLVF